MVDRKGFLLILILITWIIFLSVLISSESCNDVERNDLIEEEEVEEDDTIDYFTDDIKVPPPIQNSTQCISTDELNSAGFNNDLSTILEQLPPSGIMYEEQNRELQQNDELTDKPMKSLYDDRLYINGDYQERAFLEPVKYTSKNISSFYDFLVSNYEPMNFKYIVNSKGPLV